MSGVLPCPDCCPGCVIDAFDPDGSLIEFTIDTGSWSIVDGRLTISGAGRITLNAAPAGGEEDSVKIKTKLRCTADGTAWVTLAENADGDRLGVGVTAAGDCITFRLATLNDAGTPDYLTQPVACFVTSSAEQVEWEICWVQGAAIDPGGDTLASSGCGAFAGAPSWANEIEATGDADDVGAIGDMSDPDVTATFTASQFSITLPAGAIISRVLAAVRCRWEPLSGISTITLDELYVSNGVISGDNLGGSTVDPLNYQELGGEDFNFVIEAADVPDNVVVNGAFSVPAGGSNSVSVDAVILEIHYTGPDHEQGTLTATATAVAGMPPGGYSGKAMAAARLYWKGSQAGLTVESGDWDAQTFIYYYEFHTLPECPTCDLQCFIFGDTFDRFENLGCHYEVSSGAWDTDDTNDILICDTTGQLYVRHLTTEESNAQFVRVSITFTSASDAESRIVLGYDANLATEVSARLRWVNADVKWYLDVYEGATLIDTVETTEGPETFPTTVEFTACLLGNTVIANTDFLSIEALLNDEPTGLQVGLYGTAGQEFTNLRFYQTPVNETDCPSCGGSEDCGICDDGTAPAFVLIDISGITQGTTCSQCTEIDATFLAGPGGAQSLEMPISLDCGGTTIETAVECCWASGIGDFFCFPGLIGSNASGLLVSVCLVRDNLTNHYYLLGKFGGPTVADPAYDGGFKFFHFVADLGTHNILPDCFALLDNVSLSYVCTEVIDREPPEFDCDGTQATFRVRAV